MTHLFELMEKILAAEGDTVELEVPEENFNLLMLRVLQAKAGAGKKKVVFRATGDRGKRLLAALSGERQEEEQRLPEGRGKEPGKPVKAAQPPRRWRRVGLIALAVFAALLLLGGGAYGVFYYLPKAEVLLTLTPIPLVKEISVVADTAAKKVAVETGTLPGTAQVVEETGTKSTPATGTATVGDKAKGSVKFINCDPAASVTFTGGTRIQSVSNNLVYILDASVVEVPARVGSNCGEKTGAVTAEKIGPSYNLPEATNFEFLAGYSNTNYDAEAAAGAVTGGSSHEVTVAAASDQTKLLEELQQELVDKAKESIRSRSGIDEVVVDAAIKSEILEKTYSHALGEQADNVSLTLKIKLTTITYRGADIQELVSQSLASLVPAGFTLFPGETEIEPLSPVLEAEKLKFQAKISANVVPEIDEQKIKEDLAGRNPDSATAYLGSLGDVNAYELKLWPNLPSGLQRVPRNIGRITVTLVTEEVGPGGN